MKGEKMRIVIVEDEPRARRGLRNLILSLDKTCEVVGEAADGRRGYALIQAMEPDVVFTDIRMPDIDGLQMITELSRLKLPPIDYVILSAYEEFSFARQAISLGVREYMVKPVTCEEMEKTLAALHRKKEQSSVPEPSGLEIFPNAHPLVRRALAIIETSYADKISQEEVARALNITPEYFSSIFRKDTGENFPRYVNRVRCEKAKKLLIAGTEKKDVPYEVGYSDPKYFYKVFRDITGQTVTEYIKTHGA